MEDAMTSANDPAASSPPPSSAGANAPANATGVEPPSDGIPPVDFVSRQLTMRAVLTGMILGGTLSICNVYTGLLIGWATNMSITGILLAFAFWGVAAKITSGRVSQLTILENNVNQASCSAAAAVSSAGLVSAVPALTLMTGQEFSLPFLSLWIFSVCIVGVTVATGLRRQMVIVDKLPFPSGIACAQTLKEIYAQGTEAMTRVGVMGLAAVGAAGVKVLEILKLVSPWSPQVAIKGHSAGSLTFSLDPNLLFIGVGGLIGFRAAWSLLLGAVLAWGVFAPNLVNNQLASLVAREPLAELPADLTLAPEDPVSYNDARHELRFGGVMSADAFDHWHARSEDPAYREALRKLRIESQLALEAPLPSLPPGVSLAGLPVIHDAEKSVLRATVAINREHAEKLRTLSADPAFQSAAETLIAWFDNTVTRPLRASVALEYWPSELAVPHAYTGVMKHDKAAGVLWHAGVMKDSTRDAILKQIEEKSAKYPARGEKFAAVAEAVRSLHTASRERSLPQGATIPAALAGVVTFDPQAVALAFRGIPTSNDVKTLREVSTDADWIATVNSLAAGAAFNPVRTNFTDLVEWLLWPGTVLMVVASLTSFAFSWRSVLRSFRGSKAGPDEKDTGETSRSWFIRGLLIALALSVALQIFFFDISWWAAVCGVLLSFVLAIVASRVSGETNVTPVGAMGKVTQLAFGAIAPASPAANLMSANVTGGAASQCADLMHDFKCGYLLGAVARKQAVGQLMGCLAGSIVGSAFYLILIPNPREQLLTEEWPAPAVATWKAVAELFVVGFDNVPPGTPLAMLIAGILGLILPTLDRFGPAWLKPFIPSAASLGLAFVIRANTAVSMFLGACIALVLARFFPRWTDRFFVTICAGLVAGESLAGAGDAVRLLLFG
jgi:uncharacterized oligopeptide transporter (OPT) family protein